MAEDLLVYGASGHGMVVLDAARCSGNFRIIGLLDDDPALAGSVLTGTMILGGRDQLHKHRGCQLVLAIGDNEARRALARELQPLGVRFASIVHPAACIAQGVPIGAGTVVMAGVVVNVGARIGNHVILNTGATVDHDNAIADFVHLSPGVHLAGHVAVGEASHLGVGVSVIPGVSIGQRCVVGAGAAVIADIADDVTAVGVPARPLGGR